MQHKVAELEGALLDAAVAKAEGLDFRLQGLGTADPAVVIGVRQFWPSGNWGDGGPIIERRRISLMVASDGWEASVGGYIPMLDHDPPHGRGPFALVAAMRAYVFSRFGDAVELP